MYAKPENGGVIGANDSDSDEVDRTSGKLDRGFGGPNK